MESYYTAVEYQEKVNQGMDMLIYYKNQITAKPDLNTHKRAYNNVEDTYLSIFFVSITFTYHTCQSVINTY